MGYKDGFNTVSFLLVMMHEYQSFLNAVVGLCYQFIGLKR